MTQRRKAEMGNEASAKYMKNTNKKERDIQSRSRKKALKATESLYSSISIETGKVLKKSRTSVRNV